MTIQQSTIHTKNKMQKTSMPMYRAKKHKTTLHKTTMHKTTMHRTTMHTTTKHQQKFKSIKSIPLSKPYQPPIPDFNMRA